MSVNRRELIRYLEDNGFPLVREGGRHSIWGKGAVKVPIKRHRVFDRITANELCRQAGLAPKFQRRAASGSGN
jgi:predicted RNA binding protein YcfA (HicA-like mRNA interferase family)